MFNNLKIKTDPDRENVYTIEFPTLSIMMDYGDEQSIKLALTAALWKHFGFDKASQALNEIILLLIAKGYYEQYNQLIKDVKNAIGKEEIHDRIKNIRIEPPDRPLNINSAALSRKIILDLHDKLRDQEAKYKKLENEFHSIKLELKKYQ